MRPSRILSKTSSSIESWVRAAPNAFGVGRGFKSLWAHHFVMPWAYIIRGTTGRHYIGSTTDLARRGTDATFAEPTGNPARAGFPLQL